MLSARRWIVTGLVQGVGYRWFVIRQAERLGLRGFVRNLVDGSVEVVAGGPDDALATFEQALRRGPSMARVDRVEAREVHDERILPASFEIG